MTATTTAVLFDLDDTLFDHRGCTRDALAEVRSRYPVLRSLSAEAIEREYSRLLEELHLEVLAGHPTLDEARIERFRRLLAFAGDAVGSDAALAATVCRAAYRAAWRPVDGALELLAALHGHSAIGIVTNNVAEEQRQKIAACGFEPHVGAASSDDSVTEIWSLVPTELVLSVIFDESKTPPATP